MGVLYRTPEGFLDLTGQRVGGKYPQAISDAAVPVINVDDFLRGRLVASEGAISATSVVGDTADIIVPDNENWLLFNVSWEAVSVAATDRLSISISLTNLPGSTAPSNTIYLLYHDLTISGANTNHGLGRSQNLSVPTMLTPGTIIRGTLEDEIGGGSVPWSIHAGIFKFVGN